MTLKASFRNVANVLLDWDDAHSGDFCSWNGVICDTTGVSVISLYDIFLFFNRLCKNLYSEIWLWSFLCEWGILMDVFVGICQTRI